jgi:hypothetical protein
MEREYGRNVWSPHADGEVVALQSSDDETQVDAHHEMAGVSEHEEEDVEHELADAAEHEPRGVAEHELEGVVELELEHGSESESQVGSEREVATDSATEPSVVASSAGYDSARDLAARMEDERLPQENREEQLWPVHRDPGF